MLDMYNYFRDFVIFILSLFKEFLNIFIFKLKLIFSGSIIYDLKDCFVNKYFYFNYFVKRV